jgi:hypothetical protein
LVEYPWKARVSQSTAPTQYTLSASLIFFMERILLKGMQVKR